MNLQIYLRAAGEDKRSTLHSFRVGGAAGHHMDGTAMDVLMEDVGRGSAAVAGRYAGLTVSAATPRGAKRSRDTASIEADVLSLWEGFVESYAAFASGRPTAPEPIKGSVRIVGIIRKRGATLNSKPDSKRATATR